VACGLGVFIDLAGIAGSRVKGVERKESFLILVLNRGGG